MGILIGADVVPSGENLELFKKGDIVGLVGNPLSEIISKADFRIYNVETPLTDKAMPIPKCGPNLIAPTDTINGLKSLKADLVTLANNHILDQGEEGLKETVRCFANAGIGVVGVGNGTEEAKKPYIFDHRKKKIAVYACAEHEFSIVKEKHYGANPFDPLESLDHIENTAKECDYLIVLYHGGKEYHRYPSPQLMHTCHRIIEKGANLVICQHSHCIGCEEDYLSGKIVYGQGNFIFDGVNNEFWQTGLLISLDEEFKISYIPVHKEKGCVRLASLAEAEKIMSEFGDRSAKIKDDIFIRKEYDKRAEQMINMYLLKFLCVRNILFFKVMIRLFGKGFEDKYLKRKFTVSQALEIINYIECEAHRELLLTGLKKKING